MDSVDIFEVVKDTILVLLALLTYIHLVRNSSDDKK